MSFARLRPILAGSTRSWRGRAAACATATLLAASTAVAAQQSGAAGTGTVAGSARVQPDRDVTADSPDATRDELTRLLEDARRRATDGSKPAADRTRAQEEATRIRSRLEEGDFRPGDRFVLTVVADSVRRADMTVREGPSIEFGALPSLSLGGVLRSELQAAIHKHLSRYFRTPEVRVQYLTRIGVIGSVGKPGSYSVPPDALVGDIVLVAAGGVSSSANPDKIVVLRNGREIVGRKQYQRAVQSGATVEELGLRSGDEIRVPERRQQNWGQIVTIAAFSISVFTAILALIRSSYSE